MSSSSTKYIELLKQLNYVNKFKQNKQNLDSMMHILRLVGNPQDSLKFIHIAGTNGKGSVSLKISKALELNGFKTGLFTSPHLFYYGERIQINGQYWEEDFVTENLSTLFDIANKNNIQLTFFDYLTGLMMIYFKEKKVDVAVIECGLGGRLDSTNVIQNPLASVITSIGLDHTEVLGNTFQEIAQEKAGIIKPNCPVIIGPNAIPLSVFEEQANKNQAKLYKVKQTPFQLHDYNIENTDIARETLRVIKMTHSDFNHLADNQIEKGIKAEQICRMESLEQSLAKKYSPYKIIFDVGHNPPALEKVLLRIKKFYPFKKVRVIYGTSTQKDAIDSLMVLAKQCDYIHLIQASHFRAMKIDYLYNCSLQLKNNLQNYEDIFMPISKEGDIKSTLDYALKNSDKSEILLICGSFFIQKEAREYFGIQDIKDPIQLSSR
ncbi:hypothetical protein ABPG72_008197 [Tetrahymena utriculariae]